MTTVRDVPAEPLLESLKEHLKGCLKPPAWAPFVKTGASRERAPTQPDWWFIRSASLLRRIYLEGPVGVSRLRTYYGGRRRRGSAAAHFRPASGNILRKSLQQMEAQGLLHSLPGKGRDLTPKGRGLLDRLAREVAATPPKVPATKASKESGLPPRTPGEERAPQEAEGGGPAPGGAKGPEPRPTSS